MDYPTQACLDLAAFPLQILLRTHPSYRNYPAAVVAEDKPLAPVLWLNEKARRQGILPGHRYASALSLAPDLRAEVVSKTQIHKVTEIISEKIRMFSDQIEVSQEEPGVFWLNVDGHQHLHPDLGVWGDAILKSLAEIGLDASLVAGFSKVGTYALAKTAWSEPQAPRNRRLKNEIAEREALLRVRLDRLGFVLETKFRDALLKLGIRTVGQLLELPAGGILERFGADAHRLHRMLTGHHSTPLAPTQPKTPVIARANLDDAEADVSRLLFLIKRLLHPLLTELMSKSQAMLGLDLRMKLDGRGPLHETVRTAAPTLDEKQILDLVRLRLESIQIERGIVELEIELEVTALHRDQLQMFCSQPKRDLKAAARALARIRTQFGDDAVVRAELQEGHLPEAQFRWIPAERVAAPSPQKCAEPHVRRFFHPAVPLARKPRHLRNDGWLIAGPEAGPVVNIEGPYVISGGWWVRPVHREYNMIETKRGDLLWVYYDRKRRRWAMQGRLQ